MRAVLDTNVLVSGLFWQGTSHALIEHARAGALSIVSSPTLLAGLAEVLERPKFEEILRRSKTWRELALADVQTGPRDGPDHDSSPWNGQAPAK